MEKRYGLFLVFLIASNYAITIAQELKFTPEDEKRIVEELIEEYELEELTVKEEKAPETPEFTAQDEDDVEERAFILFLPLVFKLAKITFIAVKLAVKSKAVITAVTTVVKAKAVVAAAAVKTAVAAASTKTVVLATVKGAAKVVLREVITDAIVDGVEQLIMHAVNGGRRGNEEEETEDEPEPMEEVTTKKVDTLKVWNKKVNKRRCKCIDDDTCQCCLKPEGFEKGCFRIKHLVNERKVRFRVLYAGKTIMSRKMKINRKRQEFCGNLPEPLNKIRFCVVTFGFQKIKHGFRLCFDVGANARIGRNICMIKRRGMGTTIES